MTLAIAVLIFCLLFSDTQGASLKQEIFDALLVNTSYDKRVPPGIDYGELTEERATDVSVQLYITEIYDVDVAEMDLSITFYLRQQWNDHRLMFNHTNVTSLQLDQDSIDRVWSPDTYFPESKDGSFYDITKPNILMHVFSNGTVMHSMRLRTKFSCTMDFHSYPLDVQQCKINLLSYGFTYDKLRYLWYEKDPVRVLHENLPLYDTPGRPPFSAQMCNYEYFLDGFSCLETTIQLKRSIGYYMTELFIPDILIVALSWVTFWLHPLAVPGRVSLGAVTVLTMSSQGSASRRNAPKVSYVKAVDVWTLFQIMFVFAAMVEFSVVNVLARKKKDMMDSNDPDPVSDKSDRPFLGKAKKIDLISRIAFPAVYLLFNFFFWIFITQT